MVDCFCSDCVAHWSPVEHYQGIAHQNHGHGSRALSKAGGLVHGRNLSFERWQIRSSSAVPGSLRKGSCGLSCSACDGEVNDATLTPPTVLGCARGTYRLSSDQRSHHLLQHAATPFERSGPGSRQRGSTTSGQASIEHSTKLPMGQRKLPTIHDSTISECFNVHTAVIG